MAELKAIYPLLKDFVFSMVVSRLNGYLGGYGTCSGLRSEIADFGLSESNGKMVLDRVCRGSVEMSCPTKKCS